MNPKNYIISPIVILIVAIVFTPAFSIQISNTLGDNNLTRYEINDFIDEHSTTGPSPHLGYDSGINSYSLTGQKIIEEVPKYRWRHGCGPTAAGMVIGYWDGCGFNELVDGSASHQTNAVNNMIASIGNYNDYCLPIDDWENILPDKSEPPFGDEHKNDSVADFMKTSQSYHELPYGSSYFSDVDDGLLAYITMKNPNYEFTTRNIRYSGSRTWEYYCNEIDGKRPAILLVDSNGDRKTDHFITAIGYDDDHHYACYNTWDYSIHWYNFSGMQSNKPFGIYGATFCSCTNWTFDTEPPTIEITSPKEGSLNIFGFVNITTLFGRTIIIGRIMVNTLPNDNCMVKEVEFYVDDKLKCQVDSPPYDWDWDETIFGRHTIKTVAYDMAGNTANDEMEVIIFNIG